jgi:multisubunit Na+/H+ antiporter MnhE subunit
LRIAPLRRPGLVAAWGGGAHLVGGAVAMAGWMLGEASLGLPMLICGLVLAALAWLVTPVLLGAAFLARRAPVRAPSPPP